jgi:ATP-binding cassette, subfamily B, bacterial HlyB/CyaB
VQELKQALDEGVADVSDEVQNSHLAALAIVASHHGVHLNPAEIIHDHAPSSADAPFERLVRCARKAGLKAKALKLDWSGVTRLRKALPVVICLKNGSCMVLTRVDVRDKDNPVVTLQDPNASEDAPLAIDRVRFEDSWTGDALLVRREYALSDEEQPFTLGLIVSLVFRERRLVRDLVISATALSLIALAPIMFWRLLSDRVLYHHALSTFAVLSITMGVLIVFETIFGFLRSTLLLTIVTRIDVRLSEYMFDKVLRLPIDFFERTQVGLIARDMNEIWRIRNFLTGQLFGTILDSLTLLVFLPVMFAFSPLLTLIVLLICATIAGWLVAMLPASRKAYGKVMAAEGARGAFLVQTLQGMRTVKSLALEDRHRRVWDTHISRIAQLKREQGALVALIQSGVRPLNQLAVSGTYALGVYFAVTTNDPVYIGALFAFLMLTQRVAGPLTQMAGLVNQFDEARTAVAIVSALVNQPKEDGHSAHGVRTPLIGHVEFSGVRFTYKGASTPALDTVSFEVPLGATLGIVGRSGSGKTTITRLLQRLHSDYEGLIKIDGVDVREYDVAHLRGCLGVVLQENFLFTGTIRENIASAKANASLDEVVRAARLAGAEEFIERLPRGYETFIYEGSPNLSGGQRQRLAIARALILDPRILILDEATSSLDPDSEAIVNANIRRIAYGRTVIVISHRLSSLVNSDAVLVLERGKVVDIAPHGALLERCEIYSGLWEQQNRHLETGARRGSGVKGPSRVS